jgi:hypothetical protein
VRSNQFARSFYIATLHSNDFIRRQRPVEHNEHLCISSDDMDVRPVSAFVSRVYRQAVTFDR